MLQQLWCLDSIICHIELQDQAQLNGGEEHATGTTL